MLAYGLFEQNDELLGQMVECRRDGGRRQAALHGIMCTSVVCAKRRRVYASCERVTSPRSCQETEMLRERSESPNDIQMTDLRLQ
jgi:hypothetical protein